MGISSGDIEQLCVEHLEGFIAWLGNGWTMSEKDLKSGEIVDLPKAPDLAFQEGWNRACASLVDAYNLYIETDQYD